MTLPGQRPVRTDVRRKGLSSGTDDAFTHRLAAVLGGNDPLILTSNPTLTGTADRTGPARPQLLIFNTRTPTAPPQVSLPRWTGEPVFSEHSYRGFAVDGPGHEALYLQNSGYDAAYWSFLDRDDKWSASGLIKMPWGAEFEKPEPIRICYQNLALRHRAAYLLDA